VIKGSISPTECQYAPPGEYIKDHSLLFHDGWWHLYSISGTAGYHHGYTGNEETISWSMSQDLVNWEFRGHVLHASGWPGFFDQHEVWAPYCYRGPEAFYLFYTGIVHPTRPMQYRSLEHDFPWFWEGHRETQGIARSTDLTCWEKISDPHTGSGVPGRDSHVVRDQVGQRWLLYSTLGNTQAHVSESQDLRRWQPLGVCAEFPPFWSTAAGDGGSLGKPVKLEGTAESLTVMRHPLNGRWIILTNYYYNLSDDPTRFADGVAQTYDLTYQNRQVDIGFAGEIIFYNRRWYRSGVIGKPNYWKLGFTEIEWDLQGAFHITQPSVLA